VYLLASPEHRREQSMPQTFASISVVIPVFNSEKTIAPLIDLVLAELDAAFERIEIVLVNDGSEDSSRERCVAARAKHPGKVKYIELARNFGEHNAVMCGLNHCTGDCVTIIDDDFQNPPSEILKLAEKLSEGYDVVFSYYADKKHSAFRNFGSCVNDWFANRLLSKPKGLYLSSFKIMTAALVQHVIKYKGPYPYIDGIILRNTRRIGQQAVEHSSRQEGRSNYTLARLLKLWLNMSTGFSVRPLRVASLLGFLMAILTPIQIIFYIIAYKTGGVFVQQAIPPGWASTIIIINFLGGIQLLLIGLIGEYIGRLYLTVNQLPQYAVRDLFDTDVREP
jgi:glycosyltransferase involved in cell wall biosynthesis